MNMQDGISHSDNPMQKIPSGIPGLDKMLNGGIIAGRPYLVVGGPGAGKSIFTMQFLMIAISQGENALYVTLEEPFDEIRQNMATFGWDTRKVRILDASPEGRETDMEDWSLDYLAKELDNELDNKKHTRVAFDSTTTLRMLDQSDYMARRRILSIMRILANAKCTSLLICESVNKNLPMESFLARGVIKLYTTTVSGEKIRALGIEKMRGTSFDEHIRPFSITNTGIQVQSDEIAFESFD
jgi:KaiC/GvpD/RAD55 family RecA-like ATPase